MSKNQQIKPKKNAKKDINASEHHPIKHVEKYQYETQQSNYNINVNCEQSRPQKSRNDKVKGKSQKKIKYITEGIQQSNWMEVYKSSSHRKNVSIKVSTLNNIEDLNVYQKPKSKKKSKKGSSREKKQDKLRHNANTAQQNTRIKMRDVKSHSRSAKKLNIKSFTSKSKDKSDSKKNIKPKSYRQGDKYDESLYPNTLDIQNSYYFSSFPESPQSVDESEKVDKLETNETTLKEPKKSNESALKEPKKSNMFLFESRDQFWKKPKKKIENLEATVDFLN